MEDDNHVAKFGLQSTMDYANSQLKNAELIKCDSVSCLRSQN